MSNPNYNRDQLLNTVYNMARELAARVEALEKQITELKGQQNNGN